MDGRPQTTPVPGRHRSTRSQGSLTNTVIPEFGKKSKEDIKKAEGLLRPIEFSRPSKSCQTTRDDKAALRKRAATAQLSTNFPTEVLSAYKGILDGSLLEAGSSSKQSMYEKWLGLDKVKLMSLEELERVSPSSALPEEMQDYLVISKDLASKIDSAVRLLEKSSLEDDVYAKFDASRLNLFVQHTRTQMNAAVRHLLTLLPEFVGQLSTYQTGLNYMGEQAHTKSEQLDKLKQEYKNMKEEHRKLTSQVKFLKNARREQTKKQMAMGLRDPDGNNLMTMEPDPDWNDSDEKTTTEEKLLALQRARLQAESQVKDLEAKIEKMTNDMSEQWANKMKMSEAKHNQVILDMNKAIKAKDFELDVLKGRLEHALKNLEAAESGGGQRKFSGESNFDPNSSFVRRESNEESRSGTYGVNRSNNQDGYPVNQDRRQLVNDVSATDGDYSEAPSSPLSPTSERRRQEERRMRKEQRQQDGDSDDVFDSGEGGEYSRSGGGKGGERGTRNRPKLESRGSKSASGKARPAGEKSGRSSRTLKSAADDPESGEWSAEEPESPEFGGGADGGSKKRRERPSTAQNFSTNQSYDTSQRVDRPSTADPSTSVGRRPSNEGKGNRTRSSRSSKDGGRKSVMPSVIGPDGNLMYDLRFQASERIVKLCMEEFKKSREAPSPKFGKDEKIYRADNLHIGFAEVQKDLGERVGLEFQRAKRVIKKLSDDGTNITWDRVTKSDIKVLARCGVDADESLNLTDLDVQLEANQEKVHDGNARWMADLMGQLPEHVTGETSVEEEHGSNRPSPENTGKVVDPDISTAAYRVVLKRMRRKVFQDVLEEEEVRRLKMEEGKLGFKLACLGGVPDIVRLVRLVDDVLVRKQLVQALANLRRRLPSTLEVVCVYCRRKCQQDKIFSYDTEGTRRLHREASSKYPDQWDMPNLKTEYCPPANRQNSAGNMMPEELESPTHSPLRPALGNSSFSQIQQGPGVLKLSPGQRPQTSPSLPRLQSANSVHSLGSPMRGPLQPQVSRPASNQSILRPTMRRN